MGAHELTHTHAHLNMVKITGMGKAPGGRKGKPTGQPAKGVQKRPMLPKKMKVANVGPGGRKGAPTKGGPTPRPKAAPVRKPGVPVAAPTARATGRHTIVLQQPTSANGSRTWSDFDSTPQAVDFLVSVRRAGSKPARPNCMRLSRTCQNYCAHLCAFWLTWFQSYS